MLLPIYTVLCLYSIGIRVQQYGLSTDRVQALFLAVVAGIWGIGYAGSVILRKWGGAIGRVNMACVAILAVIVIAMNSPLLDPFRLAANNQLSRLKSGKISPSEFDYIYTRFSLGRYGNNILRELSGLANENHEVKNGIDFAMSVSPEEYLNFVENNIPPISKRREIINSAKVFPEGRVLDSKIVDWFVKYWEDENSILRGVTMLDEIAFAYIDVSFENRENRGSNASELILLMNDGGVVYDTSDNTPNEIGFFNGKFDPRNLRESDLGVMNPVVKDLSVNNTRVQIELLR